MIEWFEMVSNVPNVNLGEHVIRWVRVFVSARMVPNGSKSPSARMVPNDPRLKLGWFQLVPDLHLG